MPTLSMGMLFRLQTTREVVSTSRGETTAQGALCWLWAKSEVTVPIPGFRTREQVKDLIGALEYGPLEPEKMKEIERIKKNGSK